MIIPRQANLKVHFAGLENEDFAQVVHKLGGVKYSLFTVFPFIAKEVGIKPMKMKTCTEQAPLFLQNNFRHTIMDSGLFTLMFGAHAGKRDEKFIEKWYQLILEFVSKINYQGTVVEVDCQKVLGVKKAQEYRKRMKKDLGNRQINVFHIEDGQSGLDEMIEFSDYIAISVPELRVLKKKNYTEQLANYIKNKKPTIDIHLLGCTENKLLDALRFCTSSDSTAWQQVNRYGWLKVNNGKETKVIRNGAIDINKLKQRYSPRLEQIISQWMSVNEKRFDYYSKYALASELLIKQYTHYAGNQD